MWNSWQSCQVPIFALSCLVGHVITRALSLSLQCMSFLLSSPLDILLQLRKKKRRETRRGKMDVRRPLFSFLPLYSQLFCYNEQNWVRESHSQSPALSLRKDSRRFNQCGTKAASVTWFCSYRNEKKRKARSWNNQKLSLIAHSSRLLSVICFLKRGKRKVLFTSWKASMIHKTQRRANGLFMSPALRDRVIHSFGQDENGTTAREWKSFLKCFFCSHSTPLQGIVSWSQVEG